MAKSPPFVEFAVALFAAPYSAGLPAEPTEQRAC